jgi:hypothetical protein
MATFGELATLDEVRQWLTASANATPPPASDNEMLARLISATTDFINQWIGRPLNLQDWIEIRDGWGTPIGHIETRFSLAAIPVVQGISVKILGQVIPAIPETQINLAAGHLFSETQLIIRGYHVPRLARCVEIQYTAGYPNPPEALTQACIEFVGFKYRERQHIGLSMQTIGGAQTQYHWGLFRRTEIGSDIEAALTQYKAVAPIGRTTLRTAPTASDPVVVVAV